MTIFLFHIWYTWVLGIENLQKKFVDFSQMSNF